MLIEFRVKNFRSFHEQQVLSMVASAKDKSHSGNLIPAGQIDLIKAAAIYGANASGKSNLVKAIQFMARFVRDSATRMNQGDAIPDLSPFRLAAGSKDQPSGFEVAIRLGNATFEYGFSATAERVHDEWLSTKPDGGKRSVWFDRKFDSATGQTTWQFGKPLKQDEELLKTKTRDNGLVLSRGAELNILQLTELFLWFRDKLSLVGSSGSPNELVEQVARHAKKDEVYRKRMLEFLRMRTWASKK